MTWIQGIVVDGDKRGRELGYPTANLDGENCPLEDGVWPALVRRVDGRDLVSGTPVALAAVSIGRRPTYYGPEGVRLVEAYLLDFSGDLYGVDIRLDFGPRIRPQLKFDGVDPLIEQMASDVAVVRSTEWPSIGLSYHAKDPVEFGR